MLETLRGSVYRFVVHKAGGRWTRGVPQSLRLGKLGRGCLGWCVYAPAGGRQARPDLIEIKSGKKGGVQAVIAIWRGFDYLTCKVATEGLCRA